MSSTNYTSDGTGPQESESVVSDSKFHTMYTRIIYNLKAPSALRVHAMSRYMANSDLEDWINVICTYEHLLYTHTRHELGPATIEFIAELIKLENVPGDKRYDIVSALYATDYYDICYPLIELVATDCKVPDMYRLECLKLLLVSYTHTDIAIELLLEWILSALDDRVGQIQHAFYRLIIELANGGTIKFVSFNNNPRVALDITDVIHFFMAYMDNKNFELVYRLQMAQMILMTTLKDPKDPEFMDCRNTTIAFLESVIQNHHKSETIVGDAYDILIRNDPENAHQWEHQLMQYGTQHAETLDAAGYSSNRQNVHLFGTQALEYINVLLSREDVSELEQSYPDTESLIYLWMLEHNIGEEKQKLITSALQRIVMDTSRIGYKRVSPRVLVAAATKYIKTPDHQKILLDELCDMAGTCTTGHYVRLVSAVLSVEDQSTFTISFDEQVRSNVSGRIRAYIRDHLSSEDRDTVLSEMVDEPGSRSGSYRTVVTAMIDTIFNDMYTEFVHAGHMNEYDFVEAFDATVIEWREP